MPPWRIRFNTLQWWIVYQHDRKRASHDILPLLPGPDLWCDAVPGRSDRGARLHAQPWGRIRAPSLTATPKD